MIERHYHHRIFRKHHPCVSATITMFLICSPLFIPEQTQNMSSEFHPCRAMGYEFHKPYMLSAEFHPSYHIHIDAQPPCTLMLSPHPGGWATTQSGCAWRE